MKETSAHRRERHLVYRTALALLFGVVLGSTGAAAAGEPTLLDIFSALGFTNIIEVPGETFLAGTYNLTLLAEFSEGHAQNFISQYQVDTNQFQVLIGGPEGNFGFTNPPITKQLEALGPFELVLDTPAGQRFFTETARNSDGMQHARIFKDLNTPGSFLIGFEDLADQDFQDVVLLLKRQEEPVQVPITFTRNLANGKEVTYKSIIGASSRSTDLEMETEITLGGETLARIATLVQSQQLVSTYLITFGAAFQGIKTGHVTLKEINGGELHGEIDGQALVPTVWNDNIRQRRPTYTNGEPVLRGANPELLTALTLLKSTIDEEVPKQLNSTKKSCDQKCLQGACLLCGPRGGCSIDLATGIADCHSRQDCADCVWSQYNLCWESECNFIKDLITLATAPVSIPGKVAIEMMEKMVDMMTSVEDPVPPPPTAKPFEDFCRTTKAKADADCRACETCMTKYLAGFMFSCDADNGENSWVCDECAINLEREQRGCQPSGSICTILPNCEVHCRCLPD